MNKVYEDIKAGISGLAIALKAPAERVYNILVKQQIVYSVVYLIIGIFSLILLISFILGAKNEKEKWLNQYDDPTPLGLARVIQGILGFILLIVFCFHIDVIITGFANPEYGAIKDIIEFTK